MRDATEQEQERYNEVAAKSLLYLYKPEVMQSVVDMVRSNEKPEQGLGEVGALVFARLNSALQRDGRDVPPDMRFAVAAEVMGNMAEIATESGAHDFNKDKKGLEGAWYLALERFREMEENAGEINPLDAQQSRQTISMAAESGELDQLLEEAEKAGPRKMIGKKE